MKQLNLATTRWELAIHQLGTSHPLAGSQLSTSWELATHLLRASYLLTVATTQPAAAAAGSLVRFSLETSGQGLQFSLEDFPSGGGGGGGWKRFQTSFSQLPTSSLLAYDEATYHVQLYIPSQLELRKKNSGGCGWEVGGWISKKQSKLSPT